MYTEYYNAMPNGKPKPNVVRGRGGGGGGGWSVRNRLCGQIDTLFNP